MGSIGPMQNVTMDDLGSDVAQVINTLGGGLAVVIGHAFGSFVTKITAFYYPAKVPAIIAMSSGGQKLRDNVAQLPFIAGNTSASIATRPAALRFGFFAPNHDPHIWLDGWYPNTLAMEHAAVDAFETLVPFWAGANTTQVLEVIATDDPFQPPDQWNTTTTLHPDRAVSSTIQDASRALFLEQGEAALDVRIQWLAAQSSSLR